jgi:hypothetical protein
LTTLVTRLIETTWSFKLYCPASSFFLIIAIPSVFLSGLQMACAACLIKPN